MKNVPTMVSKLRCESDYNRPEHPAAHGPHVANLLSLSSPKEIKKIKTKAKL